MGKYAATDIGVREMLLDLRKVFENDDEILAFRDTLDLSDIEISGFIVKGKFLISVKQLYICLFRYVFVVDENINILTAKILSVYR